MQAFNRFPVTWGRVATVLRTHVQRGVRNVHLTGGAPTIHPRFVDILKLAKQLRMRPSIGTIGTMLARPDFADAAMPFLDEALFSVHGPDAETHDAMARRPGSFETVTTALANAQARNPRFRAFANTVITRHNVERLPDTVADLASRGVSLIVISNTTPEGAAFDHYSDLAVPLDVLARVLPEVPARAGAAVLRFFGMPMCLMGEHRMLSNDLHWDPRVTVEWARHGDKVVLDDFYNWEPNRKRALVNECQGCALNQVCMGVYDRYAELWPTDALRPE